MYCKSVRRLSVSLPALSIAAALSPAWAAQGSSTTAPATQINRFLDRVAKAGYLVEEGDIGILNANQNYCAGLIWSAMYPNVNSPYLAATMPTPAVQTAPNSLPVTFRQREDEAVVAIGVAPPPLAYFSFNVYLMQGTIRKDVGPPVLWTPVVDPVNNLTMRTTGATPFSQPFAVVSAANQRTLDEVHAMLRSAGLQAAINDQPIPEALFRLGLDAGAPEYMLAARVALFVNQPDGEAYIGALQNDKAQRPIRVFRMRPKAPAGNDQLQPVYASDPIPVPQTRVAGTGTTELNLYPTLQLLRQRIVDAYAGGYTATDLPVDPAFEKPYSGLQREKGFTAYYPLGDPRGEQDGIDAASTDAIYLGSGNFAMPSGAFIVAYGVNHRATNKASYSSVTVYSAPAANVGLVTAQSPQLLGSARDYIADQANADLFYAWTFTRGASSGSHVTPLPSGNYCQDTFGLNVEGVTVDLDTLRLVYRSYLEPATNTHPREDELVLDRLILFTPK